MARASVNQSIRKKYEELCDAMDERQRGLWAATEAGAIGRGGMACVAEAKGMSHVCYAIRHQKGDEFLIAGRAGGNLHPTTLGRPKAADRPRSRPSRGS